MKLAITGIGIIFLMLTTLQAQSEYTLFRTDVQYLYGNTLSNDVASYRMGIKVTEDCQDTYTTVNERLVWRDPFYFTDWEQVPAFAGYRICQGVDTTILRVGEFRYLTLLHRARPGSSWLSTVQDSVPIYATVDSIRMGNHLELSDSLKYISFHAGTPDSSTLTNIVISQQYGLITGTYFWDILEYPRKINLIGLSEPTIGQQVGNAEVFFNDPGEQEIHVESSRYWYPGRDEGQVIALMKLRLRSREILGTDHYRYTYNGTYFTYVADPGSLSNPRDTSDLRDTTLSINIPPKVMEGFREQPGGLVKNYGFEGNSFFGSESTTLEHVVTNCIGMIKKYNYPVGVFSDDVFERQSISYTFDGFFGNQFYERIGMPFYNFAGEGGTFSLNWLRYVRDDGRECGTPLDFSGLTSLANDLAEDNTMSVFPNPTGTQFFIEDSNQTPSTAYQIIDLTGRKVLQEPIAGYNTSIDVSGIPAGVYFVLKLEAGTPVSKRQLVVR